MSPPEPQCRVTRVWFPRDELAGIPLVELAQEAVRLALT